MTPNKEDYLKCINELGESQAKVTNKGIAELMGVSAPAVSEMVKKMSNEALIAKDQKVGYHLTPKGLLLVSELHYSPDEIHQEAEVLEHTVSTTFIDRLEESLGFPKFCPHGGTIPQKGELLQEIHRQPLNHISELGTYRICRVHDEVHLLNYLQEHHLAINDVVELVKQDSYAKTHTLIHNSQTLIIPERVAEQIYLEKIESL